MVVTVGYGDTAYQCGWYIGRHRGPSLLSNAFIIVPEFDILYSTALALLLAFCSTWTASYRTNFGTLRLLNTPTQF